MTKITHARLRRIETHRTRLRDLQQMTDAELHALIAEELGISSEEVAAMSDEELEQLAGMSAEERE